jgi:hypothetical protein
VTVARAAEQLGSRPLGRHRHLSESKQPSMSQAIAKTVKGPVEYRLEGNGPTVMVLNGGHCSRESRLSHERLAEHGFSVLTPSRPGYDSTPSEVGRTAQQAGDALARGGAPRPDMGPSYWEGQRLRGMQVRETVARQLAAASSSRPTPWL